MTKNDSFVKAYFKSWVSASAFGLLLIAAVIAWVSTNTGAWTTSFLQDISTDFVGIAVTVWLVNFFFELQSRRLSYELRASSEIAVFLALQRFIQRLPQWLPEVDAPDNVHWPYLQWMQEQIDYVRGLCDTVGPGTSDPELQNVLSDFKLRQNDWFGSLANLTHLMKMTAPAKDRAPAFAELRNETERLLGAARALEAVLAARHDFRKSVLRLEEN